MVCRESFSSRSYLLEPRNKKSFTWSIDHKTLLAAKVPSFIILFLSEYPEKGSERGEHSVPRWSFRFFFPQDPAVQKKERARFSLEQDVSTRIFSRRSFIKAFFSYFVFFLRLWFSVGTDVRRRRRESFTGIAVRGRAARELRFF